MSGTNPLASRRAPDSPAEPHPMLRHAQIFAHVNNHSPEALQAHVGAMEGVLPTLGALAANPNVTAKDVIKAATKAVADGHMSPSRAVANIADMPADPDKLRGWLKERYADALAVTVHAKAALQRQAMMVAGTHPGATGVPMAAPSAVPAAPPPGVPVQ